MNKSNVAILSAMVCTAYAGTISELKERNEVRLTDTVSLQHRFVGYSKEDKHTKFDAQEIYILDSTSPKQNSQMVFKNPSLASDSQAAAQFELLLDAKIFGGEIEAVFRVRGLLSSTISTIRFKNPSGTWEFAGYVEIPDTNTFNASVTSASLSAPGQITAEWSDGSRAQFSVSQDGVIMKDGIPYRPKFTRYDESESLAAGQRFSYHLNYIQLRKQLEQLGVVTREGYKNGLPSAQNYRLALEKNGYLPDRQLTKDPKKKPFEANVTPAIAPQIVDKIEDSEENEMIAVPANSPSLSKLWLLLIPVIMIAYTLLRKSTK
jgi:hypothetical protein